MLNTKLDLNKIQGCIIDKDMDGVLSFAILKTFFPHLKLFGFYDTNTLSFVSKENWKYVSLNPDKVLGLDTNITLFNTIDHHLLSRQYVDKLNNDNLIHINPNCIYNPTYNIIQKCPFNTAMLLLLELEQVQDKVKQLDNINQTRLKYFSMYGDNAFMLSKIYKDNFEYWLNCYQKNNNFVLNYANLDVNNFKKLQELFISDYLELSKSKFSDNEFYLKQKSPQIVPWDKISKLDLEKDKWLRDFYLNFNEVVYFLDKEKSNPNKVRFQKVFNNDIDISKSISNAITSRDNSSATNCAKWKYEELNPELNLEIF